MSHELCVLADATIKSGEDSDNEPAPLDVDGTADMDVDNETE